MIISKKRRFMFLMTPRTGTNSIRTMFEGFPDMDEWNDYHFGYSVFSDLPNLNEYKVFGFYRDPFDRAISLVNYLRRGRQHSKFFHAFYGDEYPISCASRKPYAEWDDIMKAMCDVVPFIEVFRKFKWSFDRGIAGRTQKPWLDGPITALPYSDFNASATRLLEEYGVDPASITIPHVNTSTTLPKYDRLSPDEEQEIRDYFSEDYQFLAGRGIKFS